MASRTNSTVTNSSVTDRSQSRQPPSTQGRWPTTDGDRFAQYAATRDPILRVKIIEQNVGLTRFVAKHYEGIGGLSLAEIASFGAEGLLHAVERFEPAKGFKFTTFAVSYIRGSILKGLTQELQVMRHNKTILSLDSPARVDDESATTVGDRLPDRDARDPAVEAVRAELREELVDAVAGLPLAERQVIAMRYGFVGIGPMTLAELAKTIGISQERARILEARGLSRIRASKSHLGSAA